MIVRNPETHNLVDTEDSANVHTRIDVAAAVQGVKYDTVLAFVPVFDDDGFLQFL